MNFVQNIVGQLYIIPFWALLLCKNVSYADRGRIAGVIQVVIAVLCIGNIWNWIVLVPEKISAGIQIDAELRHLAKTEQKVEIAFRASDLNGLQYNLKDYGIKYSIKLKEDLGESAKPIYNNWIYYFEQ